MKRTVRRTARLLVSMLVVVSPVACTDDDASRASSDAPAVAPSITNPSPTTQAPMTEPPPSTTPLAATLCRAATTEQAGIVTPATLDELSGLEASGSEPSMLWAIEDSGNEPELFALDVTGAELAELDVDARNFDWEALADGPDGTLYIGDIGDNLRIRSAVTIYSIDEPDDPLASIAPLPSTSTRVRYPDGPRDAEAMFVDPLGGDLYIVTKALDQLTREFETDSIVYRIPRPTGGEVTAVDVGRLQLGDQQLATGADITADGGTIALRTYTSIHLWERRPSETVSAAFSREPCTLPGPPDRIGESITILADGSVMTSSEGTSPPLWRITPTAGG